MFALHCYTFWQNVKTANKPLESVEEIGLVEYAENTAKSGNTIKVSEISILTLEVEKLMRLIISKNISYDKEQFDPEKLTVIFNGENAKNLTLI